MKCNNCENEYEGNFCSACGASNSQPNIGANSIIKTKPSKKKIYKKWWFWLVIVVVLFIIIGIFSDGDDNSTYIERSENNISNSEKAQGNNYPQITKGDKVTIKDVCEFNIDYFNITSDVLPPHPDSFYEHYEAESGKKYVDICVGYKNLYDRAIEADEVGGVSLSYANKYQYTGFSMIEEENRSDFTYSNITSIDPLNTEYIHYLIEIPEEAANGTESLVVTLTIQSKSYILNIR